MSDMIREEIGPHGRRFDREQLRWAMDTLSFDDKTQPTLRILMAEMVRIGIEQYLERRRLDP